ncbi:TIGR04255 family protein [Saccharothrix sp. NRRL B-16348]|uniref:TIGR04255 family protein n=1 Tax=Saccharothrix sp. NRRL B-16348 TaxID=1415542 RepID=UPI0018D03C1F|nr:TIGR04255 family protein [Saccharothrix sp. NRRL B-16348]
MLFDPVEGVLAADVGDLLGRLRPEYPKVAERSAMPPWNEINVPGIKIIPDNEAPPYCWWISNEKNDRLIRFQFDRLICSWRYTPGGNPYPEYRALLAELQGLLNVGNDWLESRIVDSDLVRSIRRVQIDYINQIDLPPADLLHGLITEWSHERGHTKFSESSLVAAQWVVDDDIAVGQQTTMKVDPDGVEGSRLSLISTTDIRDDESYVGGFDRIHDRVEQLFLSATSEDMHLKWGKRS